MWWASVTARGALRRGLGALARREDTLWGRLQAGAFPAPLGG